MARTPPVPVCLVSQRDIIAVVSCAKVNRLGRVALQTRGGDEQPYSPPDAHATCLILSGGNPRDPSTHKHTTSTTSKHMQGAGWPVCRALFNDLVPAATCCCCCCIMVPRVSTPRHLPASPASTPSVWCGPGCQSEVEWCVYNMARVWLHDAVHNPQGTAGDNLTAPLVMMKLRAFGSSGRQWAVFVWVGSCIYHRCDPSA